MGQNKEIIYTINPYEAGPSDANPSDPSSEFTLPGDLNESHDDAASQPFDPSYFPGAPPVASNLGELNAFGIGSGLGADCGAGPEVTANMSKEERARCGLPVSLNLSEQNALMSQQSTLQRQLQAVQVAKDASARKIKMALAAVGGVAALYLLYKWYRNKQGYGSNTGIFDTVKGFLGFKSNPPKRRKFGDLSSIYNRERPKQKRKKRKQRRRAKPNPETQVGWEERNDDEPETCHVVDCNRPCEPNEPYCKKCRRQMEKEAEAGEEEDLEEIEAIDEEENDEDGE